MSARISRYPDGRAFLAAAEPFLLRCEAENNLILGRAPTIQVSPPHDEDRAYLATVEIASEVVGCALRTPPHSLVVTRLPAESLGALVADVAAFYARLPGVFGPEQGAASFAKHWSAYAGCAAKKTRGNRIYQAERLLPVLRKAPGDIRLATATDLRVVTGWLAAFLNEVQPAESQSAAERAAEQIAGKAAFLWEDGQPLSMAAWTGKTRNGVRVNMVYTPPAFRGRGYASACVHALSDLLLQQGNRFCFLFADLANPTSNGIYLRIGYQPVCDTQEYAFDDGHPA